MPRVKQASIDNVVRAISLLVQHDQRVSTRHVNTMIGGSRRDITRIMRELRVQKKHKTWTQWIAKNPPSETPEQPVCSVCGSPWQPSEEDRGGGGIKDHFELAKVQIKHREALARFEHERRLQAEPKPRTDSVPHPPPSPPVIPTSPLQVCAICGNRYRPAYEGQPPCCLNESCGIEFNRRLHQG